MSNITLADLNSIFQLYVALGIGVSTLLEPHQMRVRELAERIRSELLSHPAEEEGADTELRRFFLQQHRQLKVVTRKLEQPHRVISAFGFLLALANMGLLWTASLNDQEISRDAANLLVAVLTLLLIGNWLCASLWGRSDVV